MRRTFLVLALAAFAVMALAVPALASTHLSPVNDGVSQIVTDLKGVVTTNVPVIMGLLALTIGVPFGIRLVRKFAK